jgi:hypothetical protein
VVKGEEVVLSDDGSVSFRGGMSIDADGSPRAYAPAPLHALDFIGNAGKPGNWWGVACDDDGRPFVQGPHDPAPGFYVSTTAYERKGFPKSDPRRYLDSEAVRFIVVPGWVRSAVGPVVLGCAGVVTDLDTGKEVQVVVGDFGPAEHLGEASMAAAAAFGLNTDPRTGGEERPRFRYTIYPGHTLAIDGEQFELQRA